MKRAKNIYDWTTEELDLLDTKRIKELNKKEYAIFRWGREYRNKGTTAIAYILGAMTGIIGTIIFFPK